MFLPRYTFTPADLPQFQRGFTYPLDDTPPFYWTLDPLIMPPLVPMPNPIPVPVPLLPDLRPNPDRVPGERTDDGPAVKPDPWQPVQPVDPTWPYPTSPVDPGDNGPGAPVTPHLPTVDTGTTVGGGNGNPPVVTEPGTHEPRPPRENEKEKKTKVGPGKFAGLHLALGAATEGADFVGALYKALPWQERRFKGRDGKWRDKDLGPVNKALKIYQNADKIDVDKAIENLIQNAVEDRIIGGLSSGARKNLARKGWKGKTNPFGTPSTLPDIPGIF